MNIFVYKGNLKIKVGKTIHVPIKILMNKTIVVVHHKHLIMVLIKD